MLITLFDFQNGKVIPSVHVHTLKFLKDIMEQYPDNYMKVYEYLFYMTCPSPILNPYFNLPEGDKEQTILLDIEADFSTEDDVIVEAIKRCEELYETPTRKTYFAAKSMLDKINTYLSNTSINGSSKDGNGVFILRAMKDLSDMRRTCKDAYKDLEEEQKSHVRGDQDIAYDQQ